MKHDDQNFNLPLPEAHFRRIASRSTFWRWGKEGLPILKIGGRRFIRESDLSAFLERKAAEGEVNPPMATPSPAAHLNDGKESNLPTLTADSSRVRE